MFSGALRRRLQVCVTQSPVLQYAQGLLTNYLFFNRRQGKVSEKFAKDPMQHHISTINHTQSSPSCDYLDGEGGPGESCFPCPFLSGLNLMPS